MSFPAREVQKDIYAALTGDVTLMALITGVFDFVPDNQAYPFIRIGEPDYDDFSTHTSDGFDITIRIHVWARPGARGKAPLYDIQDNVYRIMHENLFSIPTHSVIDSRFLDSRVLVDGDAVTYHGIQTFRLLLGGKL